MSRFRTAAVVAAAAGVAGGVLAAVPAGAQATGWVSTATQAEPVSGLTDLGPTPAGTPLTVTVSLALRNRGALQQSIAAHRAISPAQFEASYSPTPAQAAAVTQYLESEGFARPAVASNRLLVTATGTAGDAEKAFDTALSDFSYAGRTAVANLSPARVPAPLAGTVVSVLGLNTLGRMVPLATTATNPASSCTLPGVGYPCSYNPQGFWAAYDAGSAPTGSSTPVAIFAEGALSQVVSDLRTEEAANGLPQVALSIVPTGPSSTDTSGIDEWDLDTQYSTGMAGDVSQLYLYDATSLNDPDITAEFNAFAGQDRAKAGSASFGECEFQAYLDGSMQADDQAFAEAAAQGQTVFASAGDTGGFCPVGAAVNGVPAGAPDVNYPASSPYVVAVGGTTLVTNPSGGYSDELAWLAGGGGPSGFESQPAWQSGVAPVPSVRNVPDVAMDADPNSGANVYVDGSPVTVGGTSLSSPLSLGVWARVESAGGNGIGFASPLLYGARSSGAFHDIVLGESGPYPALPGYDLATGIGSFDVAKTVSTLG